MRQLSRTTRRRLGDPHGGAFAVGWKVEHLETRWCLSVPDANWEPVITNGPHDNRVDIVFLGDGYTASEIDTVYANNIAAMLDHMFNDGEDPFPRYRNFFNVSRLDVISAESGVDEPQSGITRDTALDATFQYDGVTDRLAYISDFLANQYVAQLPFAVDMRYVTLNSSTYGGGGGYYAVYSGNNESSPEVALHEQGHSFAGLADEYDYGGGNHYSGGEPAEPNVTTSSNGDKWSEWLGYDQPGIGVIGAYEGARYYQQGLYRPSDNSKMRSLGQPFDAIGREAFIQRIYEYVRPIDEALTTIAPVSTSATLWADIVDPLVIQMQWYVDDLPVTGATGPYFVPADYGFGTGNHTVMLQAWDDTDWVRRGIDALYDQRVWQVQAGLSTPGLVFSSSAESLDLTEGGVSQDFEIRLSTAPSSPVTLTISDNGQIQTTSSTLTFTTENWNQFQTITVSALTDAFVDGNGVGVLAYQLASEDAAYGNLAVPETRTTVRDTTAAGPVNHAPVTSPMSFTADPQWVNGTYVGTLYGYDTDLDQTLTWSITAGNESGLWSLNPGTGQLSLADASQLDPENTLQYTLYVGVTDDGTPPLTTNTTVTINVLTDASPEIRLQMEAGTRDYTNPGTRLILDPNATVQTFGGDGNFQGVQLSAKITGKHSGKDRLVLDASGSDPDVVVTGSHISYKGLQVGTVLATKPKQGVRITFNSSANDVSIQAVIRRLAFQTTSRKRATRTVETQLSNYAGTSSDPQPVDVRTV